MRWNPYKGVLGIWYEWEIIENKFKNLIFLNGDECGSVGRRSTKVILVCNSASSLTEILRVSEPNTCKYEIELSSPFACETSNFIDDTDDYIWSMNVYPHMNTSLKLKWDQIYSEHTNGFITDKVKKF